MSHFVRYSLMLAAITIGPLTAPAQVRDSRGSDRQATAREEENKSKEGVVAAPGVAEPPGVKPPPGLGTGVAAPVDPKGYKIGAEDVLRIQVWNEPQMSGPVQVRPDGKFTLPLIGDVQAAGLTPEQLKDAVAKALEEHLVKPEVMVSVQQVLSKKYYITGEVMRTGAFPLIVPITVMEAVSAAGGFREFANKKKVTILRGKERLKFNYNDVIKGKNLEQNITLENGDYIIVP